MSTGDPNQNGVPTGGGEGNDSPVESQGAPAPSTQPPGQQEEHPDSLANGFLKNIPELDRQVVSKYIKDWDAGVTRKFQEIHSQYEPYKQLQADPAELQAAYEIYQQLNSDPQAFYQALANALEVDTNQQQQQQNNQQQQQQNYDPSLEGLPPQFVQQVQQQQQVLEAMANWIINQQTTTQQQQEDQELDNYLNQLRQQYGDFDESYVLSKMYAEKLTGEQAIQAWQQAVQGYVNQNAGAVGNQQQGGFKPLHGGGSVPADEKKVTDLSRKETKDLVTAVLQQQAEGQ